MIRRSSAKKVARPLLIGALALLIPAAIAGCEAGFDAPTLEYHQASGGAHVVVSGITVSNLFVLGAPVGSALPQGSSASVFLSLFNGGSNSDSLVSVSAPGAASSGQVSGGTVSLPANSEVNLTGPQPSVVLNGLTSSLSGGQDIPVTLDFAHAGSVTVQVPVQPQSFYYSTYSAAPTPVPTPSATPTPTPTSTKTAAKKSTAKPSTTPTT